MAKKEKVFQELTKTEKANIKQAKLIYPKRIKLYQDGCNLLNDVINEVSKGISEGDKQDIALISLSNRIIGTSKAHYELCIRGYQYDSTIIVRGLYECSLVLWYVERSLGNTEKWISGKVELSDIKKELTLSSDEKLRKFYSSASNFVHSNFEAVFKFVNTEREGNLIEILHEPFGLPRQGDFLPNFWAFPLTVLSKHYQGILSAETKEKINRIINQVHALGETTAN